MGSPRAIRQHWSTLAASAIAVTTLVALGWRILQGIDFSDEAFYLAIPMRVALGDQPFVDELNIAQTAGLLLYPFVKAYTAIAGTTGIFLFIRIVYLLFFAGVGWSAYALIRPLVPRPAALLVATACLCFIPYGAPGLGYNTLSMGLSAIGLFTIARWLLVDATPTPEAPSPQFWRSSLIGAGSAHAAACLAYPTLVLSALMTAGFLAALAPRGRRFRAVAAYAAGGLGFALLISPVFIAAGLGQLRQVMAYTGGSSLTATFSPAVMAERFSHFVQHHPELGPGLLATVVAVATARRWPRVTALTLPMWPLLALGSKLEGYSSSLGFVAGFALLGPLLCFAVPDRRVARALGIGVIAPSIFAAVLISLSSSNASFAAGVGLYPAMIATAMILAVTIDRLLQSTTWARLRPTLALAPAGLVMALMHYNLSGYACYRDGPLHELTERIHEGPYWGLSTSPSNRGLLRSLTDDLLAYRGPEGSRIYCNIPATYLIAERRPLVASPWTFPSTAKALADNRYFLEHARTGDLLLELDELNPQLKQVIATTSDLVAQRASYAVRIYRGYGQTKTPPTAPALAYDVWHTANDGGLGNAYFSHGWSWPEGWGRWNHSYFAGMLIPLPRQSEQPARDVVLQLDLVAHSKRGQKRQRYRASVTGTLVAEGEVIRDGGVIEIAVPAALVRDSTIYLTLEVPTAFASSDGRLLGIGLRRMKVSLRSAPASPPP